MDSFDNEEYEEVKIKVDSCAFHYSKNNNWERLFDCQIVLVQIGELGNKTKSTLSSLYQNHSYFPDTSIYKAKSIICLASTEDERGYILKSLNTYKSAIRLLSEKKDSIYLQAAYNGIGLIYTQFGDYTKASKYLNASKEINRRLNNTDYYIYNLFNLADNAYFNQDYINHEKIYREIVRLEPEYESEFYFALSKSKSNQNKVDSAKSYFQLAEEADIENYLSKEMLNDLYSDILCNEGNYEDAIQTLKKNEESVFELENNRDKGEYYFKLGNLFSKQNKKKEALINFNKSLQLYTNQEVSTNNLSDLSSKKYLFNEIWIGDILLGLSNVYNQQFKEERDEDKRVLSEKCLHLALEALDFKRSFFEDIESSIFANRQSKELYETAIDTYLDWYEESGENDYLNSAFEIAQRHNAFILRQQINERIVLNKYQVEESLQQSYFDQKVKVLDISNILYQGFSQEEFERYRKEEIKLDSLIHIIQEKHPQFEITKNNFSVASIQEIQKELGKKEAVIKYFEGKEKLYTFVIHKKKAKCFVHKNTSEIKDQVLELRSILSNNESNINQKDSIENYFLKTSFLLFQNILEEELTFLPKKIKKLTIIPTGVLKQIPFEPLVTGEKNSWGKPNNYLINDYAISYHYFCNALTDQETNSELTKVLTYGLEYDKYTLGATKKISNDSISKQILDKFRSEEMGHLYYAPDEAMEVAEMFGGTSYINEKATKANFLSNVNEFDLVHLSAHSFVDLQNPGNSAIIFTKKDSLTDHLLQVKDVDRLKLSGQLFTLSACNTFFGKENDGEGLSSMAKSFIQSGAGSVIGSFWSVPDEISKTFMVHFYAKLKEGMTKDEALRETKIDFMTDDDLSSPLYRSPMYWSAWVTYGDTQSIYKSKNWMMYSGFGVLLLAFLLFIIFSNPIARPKSGEV